MITCKLVFKFCFMLLLSAGLQAALPPLLFAQALSFTVLPDEPRPGDAVTVAALGVGAGGIASLYNAAGKRVSSARFFHYISFYRGTQPSTTAAAMNAGQAVNLSAALLAVPSTVEPGTLTLKIEVLTNYSRQAGGNGENGSPDTVVTQVLAEYPLVIAPRKFNAEEIPLNQSNTDIRTKPDPEKTAQTNQLWSIISRIGSTIYSEGPFIEPVNTGTRRTSMFGDRRVYVYTTGTRDTSIHAGVDYGVPTGTPVKACARGKVVLSRWRIATGFSVILEHLPGVYSLYYHLNTVYAAEGGVVEAGTVIGDSGATGLATGPHLHWEIRVFTENTDPDSLVSRAALDKNLILSKLGLN